MKCGLSGHNSWPGFTVSKPMNMKVRIRLTAKRPTKRKNYLFTFTYSILLEKDFEKWLEDAQIVSYKQELSWINIYMPYNWAEPFHSQDLISDSPFYHTILMMLVWIINYWINLRYSTWYFSLFLSLVCLILYWYCKEKFCLGHS